VQWKYLQLATGMAGLDGNVIMIVAEAGADLNHIHNVWESWKL